MSASTLPTPEKGAPSAKSTQVKLSLVEVFYNTCIASGQFLTPFLQSLGFQPSQIGILNSIDNFSRIFTPPAWGIVSDRLNSSRTGFIICLGVGAVSMLFVPTVAGAAGTSFLPLLAILVLCHLFTIPSNTMMETWILQVTNHHKSISYGSIRLWASVGYAVMALAYSVLLKYLPVSSTFYFYALMAVPAILLAFTVPRTHHESAIKKRVRLRDMPFKQLASYWTISYALFAILKQIPSGWQAQYLTFLVTDYGYDYAAFAAFMCLTAFCEVPSLFFSRRIINRFGLIKPIIVGVCLSVIEVLLYAFGTGLPFLVAGQIIKGLSFGLLMACQMQYVYRLAPKGLEVTTQAALGSISSIVGIFAAMGGGYLLESLGVRPFYMLLGGMHTLAVLVFVGGIVLGRFVMKRPLPEEIS